MHLILAEYNAVSFGKSIEVYQEEKSIKLYMQFANNKLNEVKQYMIM